MITKETCYVGTCDNCGEIFNNGEYSMFPLESDVKEQMGNSEWYTGKTDKNHIGKHYCTECFKYSETENDVIIVDITRFVAQPPDESTPEGCDNF